MYFSALVRDTLIVWTDEWSANLDEILKFTVSINGWSSGFSTHSSHAIGIDLENSLLRNLTSFTGSLLFVFDSAVNVLEKLFFESLLSTSSNSLIFGILLLAPMLLIRNSTCLQFRKVPIGKDEYSG